MTQDSHGWRVVFVVFVVALTVDLHGQDTISYYRFEEGIGEDVIDDETGDSHGLVAAGAVFSPDTATILGGPPNDVSMDFTGGGSLQMDGITFLFHDFTVGGVEGDATLEWFMKAPGPTSPVHSALFWTGPGDSRVHVFWSTSFTGAPDSDRFVSGDWAHAGSLPSIGEHSSGVPLELDRWYSVAIVRTATGGLDQYQWDWYYDGQLNAPQTVETSLALPAGLDWTVNGRGAPFEFAGFMDEIRMTEGTPGEFLLIDRSCPEDDDPNNGDTHCLSLTVEEVDGLHRATVEASDDTNDGILYTIVADNGAGGTIERTPTNGEASFLLTSGTWTFSASVDDDTLCNDAAADMSCDPVEIDVKVVVGDPVTLSWYRFDDQGGDSGLDVTDDVNGDVHGDVSGEFSNDVALLVGETNTGSMDFTAGGSANIDGITFVFHDAEAGGAPGDATLEFLVKPPGPTSPVHSALFWTGPGDSRVHVFWGANFTGAPSSERFITGDWQHAGSLPSIGDHANGVPLELDKWHHVAIIRTALGGDNFLWEWYFNGEFNEPQTQETSLSLPAGLNWTINGRGGFHFDGFMDEVRMSLGAVDPDDFITIDRSCPEGGDPENGDTHCNSFTVNGQPGNPPGVYSARVVASDETVQPILYTITADCADCNGGQGQTIEKHPNDGVASFLVTRPGTWTFTASVDDDPDCGDAAADMSCDPVVIEVVGDPIVTLAWYRFEDGFGTDVIDDVTGDSHGTLEEGAVFSADAVPLAGGLANDVSIDFTQGGSATINGVGFIFHDPSAGGADGDATLEFLVKAPGPLSPTHSALFWTGPGDSRVHVFWGTSFTGVPDSERFVSGDWAHAGVSPLPVIGQHGNGVPLGLDLWHSVAIVRTALGGADQYQWDWYYNGELNAPQTAETSVALPAGLEWTINGRGGFHFTGLMDEIRMSFEALAPEDFLAIDRPECPTEGDTHCQSLEVTGPREGGEEGAPGTYTLSATAADDSGDNDLMYTFTVESDLGGVQRVGPQLEPDAEFFLLPATWTLAVTIDDDSVCLDVAGDASCEIAGFEVAGDLPPSQFYFRFEEDDEFTPDVVDDVTGAVVAELTAGGVRSSETPGATVPLTGAANDFSVDFAGGGSVVVDGLGFIFHDPSVGGAAGDATLEWYLYAPSPAPAHSAIFWTGENVNRYNIFWNTTFTGAPDSERFVSGDFFNPDNTEISANGHDTQFPLSLDEWHHIAIVRTALGGANFEWDWYYDGVLHEFQTAQTAAPTPNPEGAWTINGRDNFHFPGLLDEIRGVSEALTPESFLNGTDGGGDGVGPFVRGDCDGNGTVGGSPTEAIVLLNFAFRGGAAPGCLAACDAEANGSIGVTDALRILRHAFLGIGEPDAPFPACVESELVSDVELGCLQPFCLP